MAFGKGRPWLAVNDVINNERQLATPPFSAAAARARFNREQEMERKLSLSVYFQLGRALRYSDADAFLSLYDSLLRDGRVEQDQQVQK